jgi:hypothetical protein
MFSCSIAGVWGRKMSETTEVSALPETRCAELRSERIVPIPQVPMPEKMFGSESTSWSATRAGAISQEVQSLPVDNRRLQRVQEREEAA